MSVFRFELKYLSRQLIFMGAFAVCILLGMMAPQGSYGGGDVHKNAPYSITVAISLLSLFSVFISTLLTANVVLKNSEHKTEALIFTTSVTKTAYLTGQFSALFLTMFFLMCSAALGIYIGTFLINSGDLGPNRWQYYIFPLLLFGLPNSLFGLSFLFATALLSRNLKTVYVTGVLMYVLYMVGSVLGNSPLMASSVLKTTQNDLLPVLMDPFGLTAFFGESRLWSVEQRNHAVFGIEGIFGWNRLLWISCSFLALFISAKLFSFQTARSSAGAKAGPNVRESLAPAIPFRPVAGFAEGIYYAQYSFWSQVKVDSIGLFKSVSLLVMLLLWVALMGIDLKENVFGGPFGMEFYPTTGFIIEDLRASRPLLLILIFYAAELAWRERSTGVHPLIYTTPFTQTAFWGAKCFTMILLVTVFVSLNICIGLTLQLLAGYPRFEPVIYLSFYYYSGVPLALMGILMLLIQRLSPNKYVGLLLCILAVVALLFSRRLGIEHFLLRYAAAPDLLFSDFNGFGHDTRAFALYMFYWFSWVGLLFFILTGIRQKAGQWLASACLLSVLSVGGYIFYQTNVRQPYRSSAQVKEMKGNYEKKYKPYSRLPQPTVRTAKLLIDLYPDERRYQVKGTYELKNNTSQPISKVLVWMDTESRVTSLSLTNAEAEAHDAEFGHFWLRLKQPLLPAQQTTMNFAFDVSKSGFEKFNKEHSVLENGSYIELEKYVPRFGYAAHMELEDADERKKQGLPPQTPHFSENGYELIDFEAIISTAPNQRVITTGELKNEWSQHNRRYFHYKTSQPVNFMFAIASARYSVRKEHYKGVALQICYLAGHEYNVPTMAKAMKDALDFYGNAYGPYQFRQLTLAEIPHYRGSATAYPGVVFCAEDLNFLGNFSNEQKVNYTYATVSHEISHQWWANQLVPQADSGYKFLTESLAKYSEAALLEKSFGKQALQRYQQADMNLYFALREMEETELPLYRSEGQSYVHYQKGGLVMYRLKELLGAEKFHLALRNLLNRHTYPQPKATAADFLAEIYAQATPTQCILIDDWVKKVMTYDLKITDVASQRLSDGSYRLKIKINAHRLERSTSGNEREVAIHEPFDIAFYQEGKDTRPMYLQSHWLSTADTTLTVRLAKKPKYVSIDPYCFALDPIREDNEKEIK